MTDLQGRLAAALGGTFRIDRELGGGGMSRVFRAEDLSLGRMVVIKVLPPEMSAGVNQDRFRREIQLAARLQHPHIVPLLSAGSADDLLWYVMPFIEGESLRARLEKQGELPVREAVQILREIADALSYAHEQGVVHRDIKPDNVLISGRHVMVTDFGVAKAVSESTGSSSLTSLGMALGTPAYMAPEQAAADPHVDHRADIYALGALGYEMLTGRPPFTGPNPQAVLAAHVTQAPVSLASIRSAIPPALSALIMRCLEKRAADRWQRAEELFPYLEVVTTPSGGTVATGAVPGVAPAKTTHLGMVGALFAVVGAALLLGAWFLVRLIGLPDWVFLGAVGLMLIGLPIVLMAARHERQRAARTASGLTPAPAPKTPLGRLTTVRGAVAGGVLAFASLGVGAGGFMALRAAGVGPFATLVTSGVINERDQLLVADFDNRSTDSSLGASVTEALRIDLARSPVVQLVEREDISAALGRMERNPETPLTSSVAREVAERAGAKAVVTGEISPLGSGYVLSARVLSPRDGRTLLAQRETADNASGLIAAVDRLSRKLREGIGESLRSIRAGQPLENVTTTSLEALRKYSQAEQTADQGRMDDAARFLEEALKLDSTFAMAWRKLAVVKGNINVDRAREIAALTNAYRLQDRLPERERLLTTALYYESVKGDYDGAIAAYNQILERWPNDVTALNNVALDYGSRGRYAESEQTSRRGLAIAPSTGTLWFQLTDALGSQGKFAAGDSVLAEWGRVAPETRNRGIGGYRFAWAKSDYAAALGWADTLSKTDNAPMRSLAHVFKANVLILQGHLVAGERELRTAIELDRDRGVVGGRRFGFINNLMMVEAMSRARPEVARRRLDSLLAKESIDSLAPSDRPYLFIAMTYAQAGDPERAERAYQAWEREVPKEARDGDNLQNVARGLIALVRDRPADAIASFRKYQTNEGCRVCLMQEIGEAFEALHQSDSAVAAYQALVTLPDPGSLNRQYTLPITLERLGEIYEGRGDKTQAVDYYTRFLKLWREADAELQPRVTKIKQRVADLVGEPKQ